MLDVRKSYGNISITMGLKDSVYSLPLDKARNEYGEKDN